MGDCISNGAEGRQPTLGDIAARAGVSRSSVSRVFRGQKKVSDENRRRILEAAHELGYVPNVIARKLSALSGRTLGALVRDPANPAYGLLLQELHVAAHRQGYDLVTMSVAPGKCDDRQLDSLSHLLGLGVAGLIVSTGDLASELLLPFSERVPIIRAGRPEPDALIPAVSFDAEHAGKVLAEAVVKAGHTKIAVVRTCPEVSFPEYTRAQATIAEIRKQGLEPFIVDVKFDSGEAYVVPLIKSGAITAVMCPTDLRQLHYLRVCQDEGISVPSHVSVTGCDGALPGFDIMGLTTYSWPVRKLATGAVASILELIDAYGEVEKPTPWVQRKYQGQLVSGRTLSPPNES